MSRGTAAITGSARACSASSTFRTEVSIECSNRQIAIPTPKPKNTLRKSTSDTLGLTGLVVARGVSTSRIGAVSISFVMSVSFNRVRIDWYNSRSASRLWTSTLYGIATLFRSEEDRACCLSAASSFCSLSTADCQAVCTSPPTRRIVLFRSVCNCASRFSAWMYFGCSARYRRLRFAISPRSSLTNRCASSTSGDVAMLGIASSAFGSVSPISLYWL